MPTYSIDEWTRSWEVDASTLPQEQDNTNADGLTAQTENTTAVVHEAGVAPPESLDLLDQRAMNLQTRYMLDCSRLSGVCMGNFNIKPGRAVNISGVSASIDGVYVVTEVTYRVSGGTFLTEFTAERNGKE